MGNASGPPWGMLVALGGEYSWPSTLEPMPCECQEQMPLCGIPYSGTPDTGGNCPWLLAVMSPHTWRTVWGELPFALTSATMLVEGVLLPDLHRMKDAFSMNFFLPRPLLRGSASVRPRTRAIRCDTLLFVGTSRTREVSNPSTSPARISTWTFAQ